MIQGYLPSRGKILAIEWALMHRIFKIKSNLFHAYKFDIKSLRQLKQSDLRQYPQPARIPQKPETPVHI